MFWLPPFSRGGAVRAGWAAAPVSASPSGGPRIASWGSGGSASGGTRLGSVAIRSPSRLFQRASSSLEGAVPIRPGGTMPVKETGGRGGGEVAGEGGGGGGGGGGGAAGEVPDDLVGGGELLGQDPPAVLGGED